MKYVELHFIRELFFWKYIPADVEGLADNLIDEIGTKIALALQSLVGVDNPWIIQIYLNDEPVRALIHEIKAYSNQHSPMSDYKKEWFNILENHLQILSAREGVFTERKSGLNWRARYRRVHMVIYRKTNKVKAEALNAQVLRLTESLNEAGIHSRRMTGKDVWTWLMPWLSGEHEHAYSFMETLSYPEQQEAKGELSETFDLGEMCLRNRTIQCSAEGKYWQLGNRYNRFITLEPYRGIPDTWHWVLEKQSGTTSFDRMPDGAVLMYTLVIDPQDQVEAQVIGVKTTSIGDGEEAKQTRKECKQTLKLMAQDNRLISCLSGIYIDATNPKELEQRTTKAIAAAQGAGFDVIEPVGEHGDLLILDTFVRGLPMAFDPYLDQRYMKRARKIWDAHAARLLPLLTRGRGSNRHGISFNWVQPVFRSC